MTEDLVTALRDLAEAEPPHTLDAAQVMHEGHRGVVRRRTAALGGGTAVLAATGLAVGVLVPAGSAGHRGGDMGALGTTAGPAGVPSSSAPAPPPAAPLDPHDPTVTHWQFGYVPDGMAVYGGASAPGSDYSTVWAYSDSGFRLQIQAEMGEPPITPGGDPAKGPTEKVPASVPGAKQAYWLGYGDGRIVKPKDVGGDMAVLAWQRPDGKWMEVVATDVQKRADWKEQTLKAAAHAVRQDRSVPVPIRLAGVPKSFEHMGTTVTRDGGNAGVEMNFWTAPNHSNAPVVMIVAFKAGSGKIADWVPPQNKNTCQDSNGLTVCVSSPDPEPAPLTAVGGAKGLLQRITSLGNDPANWTTDVIS